MRKIFISAGHSNKKGVDRGAAGNGFIEGELTVELRDLIVAELKKLGYSAIIDSNDSVLKQTIAFFSNKVSKDSIVLDLHWNAATPKATGTETLIPAVNTEFERKLAFDLSTIVSETLGIQLRGVHAGLKGVKTEADSHHGRLGWMRLTGENILMEVCFISSVSDMASYQKNKQLLAQKIACKLLEYASK